MNDIFISGFLAALVALKPVSYFIKLAIAAVAFGAAMNSDRAIARVVGLVWLVVTGGGLLFVGIGNGTVVDIVLGLVAIGAAAYSWWYTRC